MSLFDLPRLHFSGKAVINPSTANNNVHLPLVTFDPILVRPVLPPRIYLSKDQKQAIQVGAIPAPDPAAIHQDEEGLSYLELTPINTPERYRDWITKPLGKSELDRTFHGMYPLILTERDHIPLQGLIPANWNYYGGLEFDFDHVTVKSVQITDQEGKPRIYRSGDKDRPEWADRFLDAAVELRTEAGKPSAVMVDVIPGLALYSQVFCDSFLVRKHDEMLISGKPCKASLRFLNPSRIVNMTGPEAASGSFHCVIPVEDLKGGHENPIFSWFRTQTTKRDTIKGICIRYDLFEVWENQQPDYGQIGSSANPARCTLAGCISPWFDGELRSAPLGRLFAPERPFQDGKRLGPFLGKVDRERSVVSLDFQGCIPESQITDTDDTYYETFDLGELSLVVTWADGGREVLGKFKVDEQNMPRQKFLHESVITEFHFPQRMLNDGMTMDEGALHIEWTPGTGSAVNQPLILSREREFLVTTDTAGIYADQHDDPSEGYRSYGNTKEPCRITVLRKGLAYKDPLQMTIMAIRVRPSAAKAHVDVFLETDAFTDGWELQLPTGKPANAIYVCYPAGTYSGSKFLIPDMLENGAFVNLRVLPAHDYDRYLDPDHPDYPTPVSFDLLYQEMLQVFDMIYPVSSIITPFKEEYFLKAWKYIAHRLSPSQWGSSSYMPTTRDMSSSLFRLFQKWAESQNRQV